MKYFSVCFSILGALSSLVSADQGNKIADITFFEGGGCNGKQAGDIWSMYETGDHLCAYKGQTGSVNIVFSSDSSYGVSIAGNIDQHCAKEGQDVETNIKVNKCVNLPGQIDGQDVQGIFGYQVPPQPGSRVENVAVNPNEVDYVLPSY